MPVFFKRIILFIVFLIGSIFSIELCVRVLQSVSCPSTEVCFDKEYVVDVSTNSSGFRDYEFQESRPEDVVRIIALGDSYTFGIGVNTNESYPKILEAKLLETRLEKGSTFQVFNMGLPAIGTYQELEILKNAVRYNPDIIILGFFAEYRWAPHNGNDLFDNICFLHKQKGNQGIRDKAPTVSKLRPVFSLYRLKRFLVNHSALWRFIMVKKGNIVRKHLIVSPQGKKNELKNAWGITEDLLLRIKNFSNRHKTRLVIVRIPFLYDVISNDSDEISRLLSNFSEEENVHIIDLLPAFRNNKHTNLYFQLDGHWTKKGHALAAKEIYNYLIEEKLL